MVPGRSNACQFTINNTSLERDGIVSGEISSFGGTWRRARLFAEDNNNSSSSKKYSNDSECGWRRLDVIMLWFFSRIEHAMSVALFRPDMRNDGSTLVGHEIQYAEYGV